MKRNRKRLAEASCRFHKLRDVPSYRRLAVKLRRAAEGGADEALQKLIAQRAAIYQDLLAEASDVRHLLLSYEGHLGSMGMYRSGGLYPAHNSTTVDLADVFAGTDLSVGLSIRSYDDFIESTYKFLVRIGYAVPFEEYLTTFDAESLSWVPVVRDLTSRFGSAGTRLWSFEAYIRDFDAFYRWMLSSLTQTPTPTLAVKKSSRNAGSSKLAMEISLEANRQLRAIVPDKHQFRAVVEAVNKTAESVLGAGTFDKPVLLPDALKRRLKEKYQADLREIRTLVPDTHYL